MQVNLQARTVRTLAGDGVKAEQDYAGGRSGRAQRLNSPWDLAFDVQVITFAGTPSLILLGVTDRSCSQIPHAYRHVSLACECNQDLNVRCNQYSLPTCLFLVKCTIVKY